METYFLKLFLNLVSLTIDFLNVFNDLNVAYLVSYLALSLFLVTLYMCLRRVFLKYFYTALYPTNTKLIENISPINTIYELPI